MAGYADDFSMSNNAIAAYREGRVPASKIKGVPAALVRRFCGGGGEWHHTSKAYNRTEFYDPAAVRAVFGLAAHDEIEADPAAVIALAEHRTAKPAAETYHNCRVEWIEWFGTLRRPKATDMAADGCTVTVKGLTAIVTLPNGRSFTKRLTTNGFSFRKVGS